MQDDQIIRHNFTAMGSGCEIVIGGIANGGLENILSKAINEIGRIEKKYSRYREDSFLSEINHAAGAKWVVCDSETLQLLDYADDLYKISQGRFDITSGILRKVWDFSCAQLPNKKDLIDVLSLIDWSLVRRSDVAVFLPISGMELDFGGFGKEYAADKAAQLLIEADVTSGYVNLAGDIRVIGPKPDGTDWLIGIHHPRKMGELIATIPISSGALATSGDYERFFELNGKRYCHILDSKTGYPVNYWQSISVIAPLSIIAGSYTTIAMLLEKEGLDFLENSGFAYLAINSCGDIFQKNN